MRTSCLPHPENEPLIYRRSWHGAFCDGSGSEASIIAVFEMERIGFIAPRMFWSLKDLSLAMVGLYAEDALRQACMSLAQRGMVKLVRLDPKHAVAICKTRIGQRGGAPFICEWCSSSVYCLQEHHYPISRSQDGTDTVSICGTCHADFHYLTNSTFISPTALLLEEIDKHPLSEENTARIESKSIVADQCDNL